MSMYDLIANNYSEIFPLEPQKIEFIKSYCSKTKANILDIGCATGDLALELSKQGGSVVGIDLNEKMIDIANQKKQQSMNIKFEVLNMLDIDKNERFDCVVCLGNTLPHLPSWKDIDSLFPKVHAVLNEQGTFIFQILNYDKIIKEKKIQFATIEGKGFIFERNYTEITDERIVFQIKYYDKMTKITYRDSTDLLPLVKNDLLRCLRENGFKKMECYSDYTKHDSNSNDFYTIYVAKNE